MTEVLVAQFPSATVYYRQNTDTRHAVVERDFTPKAFHWQVTIYGNAGDYTVRQNAIDHKTFVYRSDAVLWALRQMQQE
jgi:hypothetical protein